MRRAALVRELGELESAHRSMLSIADQLKESEAKLATLSRTHDPQCEQLKKVSEVDTRRKEAYLRSAKDRISDCVVDSCLSPLAVP